MIFYISTTGNDLGTGSQTSPWKTLKKATQMVTVVGDIIHVNAGTYVETQQAQLTVGVSLEGDGNTSVLKSTLSADWTAMLQLISGSEGTNGNQYIRNLKFDGQNLQTFWGIEIVGRSNVEIDHCTIVDFYDRGIIYSGRTDNQNAPPTIYATGNSFHDNILTNCARYTPNYGAGCLNIGGQKGMLIYNNTISQDSRTNGNNGWPIKYWLDGYLDGCKIYNNTFNKKLSHSYLGDGCWDFAIELFNVRGLEIYENTFVGGGIDLNYQDKGTYPFSAWIHHNIVSMPVLNTHIQTAVTLEFQSETVIIEDNVFDKVNIGVNYAPRSGSRITDNTIRRNVMTNVGKGDGFGGFVTYGNGASNLTYTNIDISNNTMVMVAGSNAGYWGLDLPNVNSGSITNVTIKNNIIQGAISGSITQYSAVKITGLNISNNDLYLNGNNVPDFSSAPVPSNYIYANNLFVNPLFVSTTDFHLQTSSPLRGKGSDGKDIGAYVGSALPPNQSPVANAGVDKNITLPVNTVTMAGNGTDADGTIVTHTWTKVSGPSSFNIITPSSYTTTITGLVAGTYIFRLTVTDDAGANSVDDMQVVVNPASTVNIPPTANAGADQTIMLPATLVLVGSGTDVDGNITAYFWSRVSGPNTPIITLASSTSTTVTNLIAGIYVFQLRVTDNMGAIGVDTVQVIVNSQSNQDSTQVITYVYSNNAAALIAGLKIGMLYRTGDTVKVVH